MEFIECTRIVPKVKMTPYGCILMQMADSPPRWQHEPRQRSMCQECERPVTIGLAPKPIIAAAVIAETIITEPELPATKSRGKTGFGENLSQVATKNRKSRHFSEDLSQTTPAVARALRLR